ncbi:MAG TPA: hypothetical protein QF753_07195 [Victivallales bacterium]|nr:hypothetical protein [Victivallales bacterium]
MGIPLKEFIEIIDRHCKLNNLTKAKLASDAGIKYQTLMSYFNGRRNSVSDSIETAFSDIIKLYRKEVKSASLINNEYIVNMFNILPDESKGYIMYFMLKSLGTKDSNHVLDYAYSILSDEKKKAFEYHLLEVGKVVLQSREEELMHEVSPETRKELEKEIINLDSV